MAEHDGRAASIPDTVPEQLATALRRYRQAMRAALAAEEHSAIPPAANWLLIAIVREPGGVGNLADRLSTAKQAVSRLADQLVTLGYCHRERDESNRRQVVLSATPDGRAAARVLLAAIDEQDDELFGTVKKADLAAFHRVLGAIATATG